MLDLKFIRENPEIVKQGIANKNEKDTVDEILALDKERREFLQRTEELKAKRNTAASLTTSVAVWFTEEVASQQAVIEQP